MNRKLPYEEAIQRQMNNLPSPDEDDSWQKMKKILDDKDKRKTPSPLFVNYKVWGFLIVLLLAGLFIIMYSGNNDNNKLAVTSKNDGSGKQKQLTNHSSNADPESLVSKPNTSAAMPVPGSVNSKDKPIAPLAPGAFTEQSISPNKTKTRNVTVSGTTAQPLQSLRKNNVSKQNSVAANKQTFTKNKEAAGMFAKEAPGENNPVNEAASIGIDKTLSTTRTTKSSIDTTAVIQPYIQDSLLVLNKDSLHTKDSSLNKENVAANDKTSSKKTTIKMLKKYFITTGVGVQQQIPVAGQQIVRYGYNGKSAFSDYIPSVYFRLHKEQKWFMQAEFIYSTPQLVKAFAYSRQTSADSLGMVTTTLRLKKMFYSEIPVSFNYYVRPNLSVGIGGSYSWLHGAVVEKETNKKNAQTPAGSVVKQIVPINGFTDSFLYRSHTYLMLQTDYQWKRLSLGLRYTKDVQPYIKYTLPGGAVADQKNWSLEFILRFRLWKSKVLREEKNSLKIGKEHHKVEAGEAVIE